MANKQTGYAVVSILFVAGLLAAFGGWCANIYKLIDGIDVITTTEAIVRVIGVFAAPVGCIAGYF